MEAYVAYDPFHKRAGSLIVAINLQSEYSLASPRTGFLLQRGMLYAVMPLPHDPRHSNDADPAAGDADGLAAGCQPLVLLGNGIFNH